MSTRTTVIACWLAIACGSAAASPGDVFVPAHRTRDGSFVPPNVAPMSGGSHLARRPTRHASGGGWHRAEPMRLTRLGAMAGNRRVR